MAGDVFMKLEPEAGKAIKGESDDQTCPNWIELHSFSHAVSQSVGSAPSTGGARTGERCDLSDFSVTKDLDSTSPKLFRCCATGEHVAEITIRLYRAVGGSEDGESTGKTPYMTYKLLDSIITSYSSSGGSGVPMESLTINPGSLVCNYIKTSPTKGQGEGDDAGMVTAAWNQVKNVGDDSASINKKDDGKGDA